MYDTQKRVALAKERIVESRRRQARRSIRSLSALCALLFLSLLGTVGTVQSQRWMPRECTGRSCCMRVWADMCWKRSFPLPRQLCSLLSISSSEKGNRYHRNGGKINEKARKTKETKRTDLCGTALHLYDAFFSFCACIGSRNEKRSGQP